MSQMKPPCSTVRFQKFTKIRRVLWLMTGDQVSQLSSHCSSGNIAITSASMH